MDLLNILGLFYNIVHPVILLIGLWFCWKISFKPGLWFFLILLIQLLYGLILSWYVNSLTHTPSSVGGLTMGEWISLHSMIQAFLQILAYGVLLFGLYRMWKQNPHIWKTSMRSKGNQH